MERSLVLLKPDAVSRHLIGEIIRRLEEGGMSVVAMQMMEPDREVIDKHYPLSDRNFVLALGHVDVEGKSPEELEAIYDRNYKIIKSLQDYVLSGPIVKMICEGENAVAKIRELVGKTDPAKSPAGSIRGDLGNDTFEKADLEGRTVYNLVHASGTVDEAEAEIKLWFPNI